MIPLAPRWIWRQHNSIPPEGIYLTLKNLLYALRCTDLLSFSWGLQQCRVTRRHTQCARGYWGLPGMVYQPFCNTVRLKAGWVAHHMLTVLKGDGRSSGLVHCWNNVAAADVPCSEPYWCWCGIWGCYGSIVALLSLLDSACEKGWYIAYPGTWKEGV
jgi:hypothetical protein